MYTIEFDDVNPKTLGFDPKEIKQKEDGTYVVERKQFRASAWDPYSDMGGDAWCPCSHDIFEGANISFGGHYYVDGGSEQTYGKSRVVDRLWCFKKPSAMYGVELTEDEERDIRNALYFVSRTPSETARTYEDRIKEGSKARLGAAPKDPYHDPFLPEKFKQMLGEAYVGENDDEDDESK